MIDEDLFKKIDREEQCVTFTCAASALVTTVRFALENDAGDGGASFRGTGRYLNRSYSHVCSFLGE